MKQTENIKLYTAKETAETLGLAYITTIKLLEAGRIPARKIGKSWKVTEEAIKQYQKSKTKDYYTPQEIAKEFNISYRATLKLIKEGKLEAVKEEGILKIYPKAIKAYLKGRDN